MDNIEKEFSHKAIIRGGVCYYDSITALEVISRCSELRKNILGLDAFIITDKTTQPVMEHSIDYSLKPINNGNWEEARVFIKNRADKKLFFEIVYE